MPPHPRAGCLTEGRGGGGLRHAAPRHAAPRRATPRTQTTLGLRAPGFAEYGCVVNPQKTVVNFELAKPSAARVVPPRMFEGNGRSPPPLPHTAVIADGAYAHCVPLRATGSTVQRNCFRGVAFASTVVSVCGRTQLACRACVRPMHTHIKPTPG